MTLADLSHVHSFDQRWRIYDDFFRAKQCRENARRCRNYRLPGWRLDHRLELRRALRAWKHYAEAVRSIQ